MRNIILSILLVIGVILSYVLFLDIAQLSKDYTLYQGTLNLNCYQSYEIITDYDYDYITVENEELISVEPNSKFGEIEKLYLHDKGKEGQTIHTLNGGKTTIYLHYENGLFAGGKVYVYNVNIQLNPSEINDYEVSGIVNSAYSTVKVNKINRLDFRGALTTNYQVEPIKLEFGRTYNFSFFSDCNPVASNSYLKFESISTTNGQKNNDINIDDNGRVLVNGFSGGVINYYSTVYGGIQIPYEVVYNEKIEKVVKDSYEAHFGTKLLDIKEVTGNEIAEIENVIVEDWDSSYLCKAFPNFKSVVYRLSSTENNFYETIYEGYKKVVFDITEDLYLQLQENMQPYVKLVASIELTDDVEICIREGVSIESYDYANSVIDVDTNSKIDTLRLSFEKTLYSGSNNLRAQLIGPHGSDNSTASFPNGKSPISDRFKTVVVTSNANASIIGGNGVSYSEYYSKSTKIGGNGGAAIVATDVYIYNNGGELTIVGGNGGAGINGSGAEAKYGAKGYDGSNGGNAGSGIQCYSLYVTSAEEESTGKTIISSGVGGIGGNGGEGNIGKPGQDASFGSSATEGGDGGDGGNAGLGGFAAKPLIVIEEFTIESKVVLRSVFNMLSGKGGKGGKGGAGGEKFLGYADDGEDGKTGKGDNILSFISGLSKLVYVYSDFEGVIVSGEYETEEVGLLDIFVVNKQ